MEIGSRESADYWEKNYMKVPLDWENIKSIDNLKAWLIELFHKDLNQSVTLGVRVASELDPIFFRQYIALLFPPRDYPRLFYVTNEYPGNYPYSIVKAIAKTGLYLLPAIPEEAQGEFDHLLQMMRGASAKYPLNGIGMLQYLLLNYPDVGLRYCYHNQETKYFPSLANSTNPYVAEFVNWYQNEYPLLFNLESRSKQVKSAAIDLPPELLAIVDKYQGLDYPYKVAQRQRIEEVTGLQPDLVDLVQQF